MARKRKAKPVKLKKPLDPELLRLRRRILLHTGAALILVTLIAVGFYHLKHYVYRDLVFPASPPKVVLANRPPWMSDFLANEISHLARPAGNHSAFDRQMLVDTYAILKSNPWIRSIKQIRRAYGQKPADTLVIDCDYRAPVALVHWGDYFWLVDGQGVTLPEAYTPRQVPEIIMGHNQKLNIRIIEGVKEPPAAPGSKWDGKDLAAGLDMVKLLFDKPYGQQIEKVDVSNFAGRRDPKAAQIVLITKYGTQIRWGQPLADTDRFSEASPAHKLQNLEAIYEKFGRVDANYPWIDLRLDAVTYPSAEAAQADYRR